MKIDNALILKLEKLAMLELNPTEREALLKDLNSMLAMVHKIEELDTDGIEPLQYMGKQMNSLRPDIVKDQLSRKQALLNAPKHDGTFFRVPKVVK